MKYTHIDTENCSGKYCWMGTDPVGMAPPPGVEGPYDTRLHSVGSMESGNPNAESGVRTKRES